ncbi:MAG: AraC family transcriptional regulator [Solidesulfovibrio sp.]|uniref:AraC family transcriptional regulator n=1 Tax=Solidesulfovibrio sp. TaxID=2910990 RepID=UPI002B1EC453|nr:AraC family transcriptional regulator [Solidesulfovibrio sp.]MEA4854804.1 AraC family transcriptional regulator [Solidesulfovibrio sp.]
MPRAPSSPPDDRILDARPLPFLGQGALALWASFRRRRFSRHAHDGYALGVIEAGALGFRYRGSRLVAPAGSINLVQPGVPHDGEPALAEGWRYRMLYLPASALAMVLPEGAPLPYFRPGVIEDSDLASRLARVHRLLLSRRAGELARQTHLLALLACWITRHADASPRATPVGPEPRAVRLVLETLDARFTENVRLAELAAATGLSPWHLARVVTRQTGLPPHAHLLERRLRAAREALAGRDRLADIAAACGFADQSHLTRAFAARFGLTPAAYRKIMQNGSGAIA